MNLYPFERTAARAGRRRRRGDREHRHRRADDDPRGGQEPRLRRRRRRARELRRRAGRAARGRRPPLAAHARVRSPARPSPTPRATTRRSRAGSPRSRRTSRPSSCAPSRRSLDLPYGENPHQRAAYYAQVGARMHVLSMVKQHDGKQLSFNNLLDLNAGAAAGRRVRDAGVRDHQAQQPVRGRARRSRPLDAYRRAFACDPMSAFGGVIALNRAGRRASWPRRSPSQFAELLFAPGYDEDALEVLSAQAEPARSSRTTSAAR